MADERAQEALEHLALLRTVVRQHPPEAASDGPRPAPVDPVAEVIVDTGLSHLDRPFDYLVPESLHEQALPGVRVKVRFAGRDLDGYVITRKATADHVGALTPLRRVVSAEPVLTPALLELATAVARRCAGAVGDVLRLAIPPRHARAEQALAQEPPEQQDLDLGPVAQSAAWARHPAGPAFLRRLAAGESPKAAWNVLPATEPGLDWPRALADAVAAVHASGRGSLVVLPDRRDVDRVDAALRGLLGRGRHVVLTADQGPQARYTAWLKVLRGHIDIVVGTRAAAFAPVANLGLAAWWDDGDDLHDEPRSPYPHVRDVLRTRAALEGCALLTGGFAVSPAIARLVGTGELKAITPEPDRRALPQVRVAGEGADVERDGPGAHAHLPSAAWRAAKDALSRGPVLVQVPRRGYLPSLSCAECRRPAHCPHCRGPLALPAPQAPPTCRWCERTVAQPECHHCGGTRLRAAVTGARRTAEELGRAFPGVTVRTSGSGEVLAEVSAEPALVISTPGAEPVAEGGYAAVLLLDGWALLDRPSLRAAEESVRRWLAAAGLCRPSAGGGVVVLSGTPGHVTLPAVEAVVRWDPWWFAERELAERAQLRLPPAVWTAEVSGQRAALRAVVEAGVPDGLELLGPVPRPAARPGSGGGGQRGASGGDGEAPAAERLLVRGPWSAAAEGRVWLSSLRATSGRRRGEAGPVQVRVEPPGGFDV